jgi:hypothetical protein
MGDIQTIKSFYKQIDGWSFRLSIANQNHLMIFANNSTIADSFMIRFFHDEDLATAWISEVVAGKHLD